jgi:hypothetical protein
VLDRTLTMAESQSTNDTPPAGDNVSITLARQGTSHTLSFPDTATISDLADAVAAELSVPTTNQKYLVPKLGLLKPPFKDPKLPLSTLAQPQHSPIKLMGATASEVASLASASQAASARDTAYAAQRRAQPKNFHSGRGPRRPTQEESTHTFHAIRALPNLPRPERSQAFLERLARDPGIVAAMRKHQFAVGLLTEMEPLANTSATHEGTTRLLGLNRNQGAAIELRLRTDAYDGYRDYKTIRNTLCHELAHNVHGPHDRNFWDLCHQIEREVAAADWKSGGNRVGQGDYYEPEPSEEIAYDHGGWTGGEFVLGGGSGSSNTSTGNATSRSGSGSGSGGALTRREIMARAAEERMKRMNEDRKPSGQGEGSS